MKTFNRRITRGLLRRVPDLNLLTVRGAQLQGRLDPIVISWAAATERVLLTHDVNTMISAALVRIRLHEHMPGLSRSRSSLASAPRFPTSS